MIRNLQIQPLRVRNRATLFVRKMVVLLSTRRKWRTVLWILF
jgi:hypothetical protein